MLQYKNANATVVNNNSNGQAAAATPAASTKVASSAGAVGVGNAPTGTPAPQMQQIINIHQMPSQFMQAAQLQQAGGATTVSGLPQNMFQIVQPMGMQTVNIDGQEAIFIPNLNAQLATAQAVNINGQQAFITPNGQIVRAPQALQAHDPTQTQLFTIPGTNIQIPLANIVQQQQQQPQLQQQMQQQQQPQQPQQSATPALQAQQQQQQQQQSQQQQHNQATAASSVTATPQTITFPGTNLQIPASVAAANGLLGNITNLLGAAPTTIKLENGQSLQNIQLRTAAPGSAPQLLQFPQPAPAAPTLQQTVAVQIPVQTANGQTIYQTVHVPVQAAAAPATAATQPTLSNLTQSIQALPASMQQAAAQMQIIPQFAQIAQIVTPNGQIQQVSVQLDQ